MIFFDTNGRKHRMAFLDTNGRKHCAKHGQQYFVNHPIFLPLKFITFGVD